MFCTYCGSEIAKNAGTYCPICGLEIDRASANIQQQPPTSYRYNRESGLPPYQQAYPPISENPSPHTCTEDFSQQSHYAPPATPVYAAPFTSYAGAMPARGSNTFTVSTKNDSALIVEIILSLFGVFGIGWLMAGETTTGVILLVCSIFIYWPIMIFGTILTFGFGLICLGPLSIGAIILNVILLNKVLTRKAAHFTIVQPPPAPHMNIPPQG